MHAMHTYLGVRGGGGSSSGWGRCGGTLEVRLCKMYGIGLVVSLCMPVELLKQQPPSLLSVQCCKLK